MFFCLLNSYTIINFLRQWLLLLWHYFLAHKLNFFRTSELALPYLHICAETQCWLSNQLFNFKFSLQATLIIIEYWVMAENWKCIFIQFCCKRRNNNFDFPSMWIRKDQRLKKKLLLTSNICLSSNFIQLKMRS